MALWSLFALIGAGLFAVVVEIFVPAMGLIGIAGGVTIVTAVVLAFNEHGAAAGMATLITALIAVPSVLAMLFRVFPHSIVGRKLILRTMLGTGPERTLEESFKELDTLVGKEGVALSDLRPSGTARIDNRRLSVVTGGEYIPKDTTIYVTKEEGSRVVVRAKGAK